MCVFVFHHDGQQIRGNDYQLGRIHTSHFVLFISNYSLKCALCAQLLQVLWAGLCDRGGPQLHTSPLRLRAVPLGVAFRGRTCAPRCLCTAGPDIARTRILPRFPHPPNRPPRHAHTHAHTYTYTHRDNDWMEQWCSNKANLKRWTRRDDSRLLMETSDSCHPHMVLVPQKAAVTEIDPRSRFCTCQAR